MALYITSSLRITTFDIITNLPHNNNNNNNNNHVFADCTIYSYFSMHYCFK